MAMTRELADWMVFQITGGRFPTVETLRKDQAAFDVVCSSVRFEQDGASKAHQKIYQDFIDHLWGKEGEE